MNNCRLTLLTVMLTSLVVTLVKAKDTNVSNDSAQVLTSLKVSYGDPCAAAKKDAKQMDAPSDDGKNKPDSSAKGQISLKLIAVNVNNAIRIVYFEKLKGAENWTWARTAQGQPVEASGGYEAYASRVPLKGFPFTSKIQAKTSHSPFFVDLSSTIRLKKNSYLTEAKRWVLGYYAANNDTYSAISGNELYGWTWLHTVVHPDSRGQRGWVEFATLYLSDGKHAADLNNFNPGDVFGAVNGFDVDWGALPSFTLCYFDSPSSARPSIQNAAVENQDLPELEANQVPATLSTSNPSPAGGTAVVLNIPGTSTGTVPATPESKAALAKAEVKAQGYQTTTVAFPGFMSDDTGTSLSSSITIHSSGGSCPTFVLRGGSYLQGQFYNVDASPTWAIDDASSTGVDFSRKVSPRANYTLKSTSGQALAKFSGNNKDNLTWNYQQNAGYFESSNNMMSKSSLSQYDEISAPSYCQQVVSLYLPIDDENAPILDLPDGTCQNQEAITTAKFRSVLVKFDFNEWVKPSEITQTSQVYTSAVSRFHFATDVPTDALVGGNTLLYDHSDYFRVDFSLTGGGIAGETITNDQIYGGNTAVGASSTDIPGPLVRSFGSGKLGVIPTSGGAGKAPGAVSYAAANLTVAFPIPFLRIPLLNPDRGEGLSAWNLFNTRLHDGTDNYVLPDDASIDSVNYAATYANALSFKPLFTCDAAWLGAPQGANDRNLVSVGGGAEISLSSLNLDLLYAVTLHDSEAKTQGLGENMTAQISYDIHF